MESLFLILIDLSNFKAGLISKCHEKFSFRCIIDIQSILAVLRMRVLHVSLDIELTIVNRVILEIMLS